MWQSYLLKIAHNRYAMLTVFLLFTTANDAPNQKPIPIYVENGSSVMLNCWHKGASHLYSRVFWFKGDSKPLPPHARVEEDGSLTLTNIRHGEVYHCVIPVRYISCVPTHNTFHIQVIGMTHTYTHKHTHTPNVVIVWDFDENLHHTHSHQLVVAMAAGGLVLAVWLQVHPHWWQDQRATQWCWEERQCSPASFMGTLRPKSIGPKRTAGTALGPSVMLALC